MQLTFIYIVAAAAVLISLSSALEMLQLSSCSQSSDFMVKNTCEKAIDGNRFSPSCSHVDKDIGWWRAKTILPAHIKQVSIYNRVEVEVLDRLNDFTISVDGVQCASYHSHTSFYSKTFACESVGQVIQITSRRPYLTLCEVEVFGEYSYKVDMLKLSNCRQSTTYKTYACKYAIDGNTNQNFSGYSCSHVDKYLGWWSAKTIRQAHFRMVRIYNRLDGISERLNDIDITVDGLQCASYHSKHSFSVRTFECNSIGSEIRISSGRPYLTLCEVQVFGEYMDGIEMLQLSRCQLYANYGSDVQCDKAIDGNTDQKLSSYSCAMGPVQIGWWSAMTLREAHIKLVRIYNRQDDSAGRLNDFTIAVGGVQCASYHSNIAFSVKTFECNSIGSQINITSRRPYLTLCEVQAFGEYSYNLEMLPLSGCSQSSNYTNNVACHLAIDGNANQNYQVGSCSRVGKDAGWWRANVNRQAYVKTVRVYNRHDCCQDSLNDIAISVDGLRCASYKSNSSFDVNTFECSSIGTQVEISSNKPEMTLCEVKVFGEYLNGVEMLQLSNCNQSSNNDADSICTKAIDGNINQNYSAKSCSQVGQEAGWWRSSTLHRAHVRMIRIYNRQDCCSDTLNDIDISVDGLHCASYRSNSSFVVRTFLCNRLGREIQIASKLPHLTLCEVQVFGEYVDAIRL